MVLSSSLGAKLLSTLAFSTRVSHSFGCLLQVTPHDGHRQNASLPGLALQPSRRAALPSSHHQISRVSTPCSEVKQLRMRALNGCASKSLALNLRRYFMRPTSRAHPARISRSSIMRAMPILPTAVSAAPTGPGLWPHHAQSHSSWERRLLIAAQTLRPLSRQIQPPQLLLMTSRLQQMMRRCRALPAIPPSLLPQGQWQIRAQAAGLSAAKPMILLRATKTDDMTGQSQQGHKPSSPAQVSGGSRASPQWAKAARQGRGYREDQPRRERAGPSCF